MRYTGRTVAALQNQPPAALWCPALVTPRRLVGRAVAVTMGCCTKLRTKNASCHHVGSHPGLASLQMRERMHDTAEGPSLLWTAWLQCDASAAQGPQRPQSPGSDPERPATCCASLRRGLHLRALDAKHQLWKATFNNRTVTELGSE